MPAAIQPYPSKHDLDDTSATPVPAYLPQYGVLLWAWPSPGLTAPDNYRASFEGHILSLHHSDYVFLKGPIAEYMQALAKQAAQADEPESDVADMVTQEMIDAGKDASSGMVERIYRAMDAVRSNGSALRAEAAETALHEALKRCRHNGGSDLEMGPVGCDLNLRGLPCECAAAFAALSKEITP